MSYVKRILVIIGALALIAIISLVDIEAGLIPDLTLLYLIPISLVTVMLGMPYGLAIAVLSAIAETLSNIQSGVTLGVNLFADAVLHLLIFIIAVVLTARLLNQLRIITDLEQKRSYDIRIAKEVHRSVFKPFPKDQKHLVIAGKLVFARELGGDYYHFNERDDKLFFCIGDISGKSIAAAIFTPLLHESVIGALEDADDVTSIVTAVNSRMELILPENMFVTLFCAFINDRKLSYVNAGHEPPLLYSKHQNSVRLLESQPTLPVGISPNIEIPAQVMSLDPGDILLAVTDGITESPPFIDNPFKMLETLLYRYAGEMPDFIADALYSQAVPDRERPADDVVIICIKKVN